MDILIKKFRTRLKADDCELYMLLGVADVTDKDRKELLFKDPIFKKSLNKEMQSILAQEGVGPVDVSWDSYEIEIDEAIIDWEVVFHNNMTEPLGVEDDCLDLPQEKGLCMEVIVTDVLVMLRVPFVNKDFIDGQYLIGWSPSTLKKIHGVGTDHIKYSKELDNVGDNIEAVEDIRPIYLSIVFGNTDENELGYFVNIETVF